MEERYGDNYTCTQSDDLRYQVYVCQSTLTHPEIEFEGYPGFELQNLKYGRKISSKIEGQGKKHHINDMMFVDKINGREPMEYAYSKGLSIDGLTDYWKTNHITYTLKFHYNISTDLEDKARSLFQNNNPLGLCNLQVDSEIQDMGTTWKFYHDVDDDVDGDHFRMIEPSNYIADAMRYTFDFSKSKYNQLNQE
jgi:hypothetical protein